MTQAPERAMTGYGYQPLDQHQADGAFDWLLEDFARQTDGVRDAVAVSADGLLIARSARLHRDDADHLAALISGLVSLAHGAARRHDFGGMKILMIEMLRGYLLVSVIDAGGSVGVLAADGADLGVVGYGMAMLADRVGELLTPQVLAVPCTL
jgi:predicted regulator of Ras-like GTPase activity (Roadblock/LC7/MglB family)